MNKSDSFSGGNIGCLGVSQIVFICMKLVKLVAWSWGIVFIPTYILIALDVFVLAGFLYSDIKDWLNRRLNKRTVL